MKNQIKDIINKNGKNGYLAILLINYENDYWYLLIIKTLINENLIIKQGRLRATRHKETNSWIFNSKSCTKTIKIKKNALRRIILKTINAIKME